MLVLRLAQYDKFGSRASVQFQFNSVRCACQIVLASRAAVGEVPALWLATSASMQRPLPHWPVWWTARHTISHAIARRWDRHADDNMTRSTTQRPCRETSTRRETGGPESGGAPRADESTVEASGRQRWLRFRLPQETARPGPTVAHRTKTRPRRLRDRPPRRRRSDAGHG